MLYLEHHTGAKTHEGKPANTGSNPAVVYRAPVIKLGAVHIAPLIFPTMPQSGK